MKRMVCRMFGHRLAYREEEIAKEAWSWLYCTRCGEEDPDPHLIWWFWHDMRRFFWRVYSWVFIPCRWCGRFSWDPRGHKNDDDGEDCCLPF